MDISFVSEYISPIALVVCLVIGYVLKHAVPGDFINQFIPILSALVGMIICAWEAMDITPAIVATGLVSGLAATGLYEAVKNLLNLEPAVDTEQE